MLAAADASRLAFWPLISALVGVACGVAAFVGEATAGTNRLWAEQRWPLGRWWIVKVGFWLVLVPLALALAEGLSLGGSVFLEQYKPRPWSLIEWGLQVTGPFLFTTVWYAHGAALGLLTGLISRKVLVALVVGGGLAALALLLWLPSLLGGGLPAWQALGLPVLLVIGHRLLFRAWAADRLGTPRPALRLAAIALVGLGWLGACLAYRVAEVPDVGEPFDVAGFEAALPQPDQGASGLLAPALARCQAHLDAVSDEEPHKPWVLPNSLDLARSLERAEEPAPEFPADWGARLDRLATGEWHQELAAAVALPPGLLLDPRKPLPTSYRVLQNTETVAAILAYRGLQLRDRGQLAGAVAEVRLGLDLSRHVRSNAPFQL
jgi:hypothetical protein